MAYNSKLLAKASDSDLECGFQGAGMQDRYVGDVGDFGKYGLLRYLCGTVGPQAGHTPWRLAVIWCLYPDETHNSDGKYVGYLTEPVGNEALRRCDPGLYEALREIVVTGNRRVSSITDADLLPPDTIYYDRILYYPKGSSRAWRQDAHDEWVNESLSCSADADIVFIDPDNGIANGSLHFGLMAPKYTFVEDVCRYFERGQSLVIYHHLSRQAKGPEQIRAMATRLQAEMGLDGLPWALWYHRGSARCYFIIAQGEHEVDIRRRVCYLLDSTWRTHFETVGDTAVRRQLAMRLG